MLVAAVCPYREAPIARRVLRPTGTRRSSASPGSQQSHPSKFLRASSMPPRLLVFCYQPKKPTFPEKRAVPQGSRRRSIFFFLLAFRNCILPAARFLFLSRFEFCFFFARRLILPPFLSCILCFRRAMSSLIFLSPVSFFWSRLHATGAFASRPGLLACPVRTISVAGWRVLVSFPRAPSRGLLPSECSFTLTAMYVTNWLCFGVCKFLLRLMTLPCFRRSFAPTETY